MTQITEFKPAIINVEGRTVTDRKLSVLRDASGAATLALTSAKGKVGKLAAARAATIGLHQIAKHASNANYRPVAEFFAARTGKPIVLSNRAAFESLPDVLEAEIMKIKLTKSSGYTIDKKTGLQRPNASLSSAMELKAIAVELVSMVAALVAERRGEQQAIAA